MKILIDECLPIELKKELKKFNTSTVHDLKWQGLKNGDLLNKAVQNGFEVFITIDKNIGNQLNLRNLKIAIIVLNIARNKIEFIKPLMNNLIETIQSIKPNSFEIIK